MMPGDKRELIRYGVVVLGYIVLAMFTKRYLTWTWGPIYFMTMLEVVPRLFHRIRYGRAKPSVSALSAPPES
jgi:hypothetical protein